MKNFMILYQISFYSLMDKLIGLYYCLQR